MTTRIAIAVSGKSTLLESTILQGIVPALIVADRHCRGYDEIAPAARIPRVLIEREFGAGFDRVQFTNRFVCAMAAHEIDLIAMMGFMTILSKRAFDEFDGRILNSHPSLLPKFKGPHAVRDALSAGEKVTGTTIHIATERLDDGPILAQRDVPILAKDTEETLHERIKTVERILYPEVLRKFVLSI